MKQLTIIATIFLPTQLADQLLGQSFGFEVHHIPGWQAFLGYGIGLELIGFFMLLAYFKRQRLF